MSLMHRDAALRTHFIRHACYGQIVCFFAFTYHCRCWCVLCQVYVWSVKTGRLLDVLAGHEGPVSGLAFSPTQPLLASCSWDK
jgi:WD40 repeat protein